MGDHMRVQVPLSMVEAERFNTYWREMGHKKLPLIARLLRARPDGEGYGTGPEPTAARN